MLLSSLSIGPSSNRIRAEPIKPAPPVIRMVCLFICSLFLFAHQNIFHDQVLEV